MKLSTNFLKEYVNIDENLDVKNSSRRYDKSWK